MSEERMEIFQNKPQAQLQLVDTTIMYARWGRGTGKTDIGGWWLADRMNHMPRSGGLMAGTTYTHLLTKLAPGIIRSWEKMGYEQDVHFWFNRFPPKKYRIPGAYQRMWSPKYSVFWFNGSYCQMVSSERGLSNGLSADFQYFDEARFHKYEKVREITMTARGNYTHFGGQYRHCSMLFTTDAPRSKESQWINEAEKKMDKKKVELIQKASLHINQLRYFLSMTKSKKKADSLLRRIKKLAAALNDLRQGEVFFSRAKTTDNIHALGPEAIWNFKKILSPTDYLISVLNEDAIAAPDSFYPLLNEETHGYHSEHASYIEKLDIDLREVEKDCLWKSPKHYDMEKPLDIALDYNNAINCLAVGQGDLFIYRLLNSFYVLGEHNEYLRDVVSAFCHFYRHHKNKRVNYYYDHTAVAKDASGRVEYYKEVGNNLRKHGWKVKFHRIRKASSHNDRFYFWLRLLSGKDPRLPLFLFDRDDSDQWRISAEGAKVKQIEHGFKKDKSTETKKDSKGQLLIRPEDSTHLSEAVDTLMDGKFGHCLIETNDGYVGESYV